MAAIGLKPLGTSLVEPFRFVHTSIKGFVLPGRPFRTAYEDAANVIGRMPGTASAPDGASARITTTSACATASSIPGLMTTRPGWPRCSQRPG